MNKSEAQTVVPGQRLYHVDGKRTATVVSITRKSTSHPLGFEVHAHERSTYRNRDFYIDRLNGDQWSLTPPPGFKEAKGLVIKKP